MKKIILFLAVTLTMFFSLELAFAETVRSQAPSEGTISIPGMMMSTQQPLEGSRCVNDNGCPIGEICLGGYCKRDPGPPAFCHSDRDCAPRRCVNNRCQF
jgi:hypothetical protein